MSAELQELAVAAQSPRAATAQPASVQPSMLSFAFCKRHGVLVQSITDGVALAVFRPGVLPASVSEVRRVLGVPLQMRRVDLDTFDQLLREHYEGGNNSAMQMAGGLVEDEQDLAHLALDLPEQADLLESDDHAPIIKLINAVLTQAVKDNASDIHIEPFENRLVGRFRVDGVLR